MALPENDNGREHQGPVIRDKRRIDPETGELRTPEGAAPESGAAAQAPAGESAPPGEPRVDESAGGEADLAGADALRAELDERVNDLKRVHAEYANYRRRVERDRAAVREQAVAQVVGELLPVLDDIGRAREHDELTGGFKSVGESLESLVGKLGLKKYGEKGDEFDPNVHEALTLVPTPGVTVPTVIEVFQPGYLVGERVLRPARVVVAGPSDEEPPPAPDADADAVDAAEAAEPATEAETAADERPADGDGPRK
ncbi:nucleotide exchange factor GrpE [Marinitenerispora sediminis]|uniref:Protein GrpE n=1 Tax=Marinitenerispora sediminis TaxID=1931232 RepID=A0A368SZW1_9ACTN|nr:nucleotide exchange factor GrpE [Marinitenerispora sediminis]RCV48135.1 nucleotide exchange factor GrpE [Marinitenerispora sediminis]RCV50283.1 nucleotide exchange factor GrpE [Marinitenerispora sediminis]RCV51588.1 nucleotide exchange factor GrpE [Marinitenerispora sediminis]